MKRIISTVLALVMCIGSMSATAFAEDGGDELVNLVAGLPYATFQNDGDRPYYNAPYNDERGKGGWLTDGVVRDVSELTNDYSSKEIKTVELNGNTLDSSYNHNFTFLFDSLSVVSKVVIRNARRGGYYNFNMAAIHLFSNGQWKELSFKETAAPIEGAEKFSDASIGLKPINQFFDLTYSFEATEATAIKLVVNCLNDTNVIGLYYGQGTRFSIDEIEAFGTETALNGDLNDDDCRDNGDASIILKHDAGLVELTEENELLADVNRDGFVDNSDAAMLLKYDAGVVSAFCSTHMFLDNTCVMEYKTCGVCGTTTGDPQYRKHLFSNGSCITCGRRQLSTFDALNRVQDYIDKYTADEGEVLSLNYALGENAGFVVFYEPKYPNGIIFRYIEKYEDDVASFTIVWYPHLDESDLIMDLVTDGEYYTVEVGIRNHYFCEDDPEIIRAFDFDNELREVLSQGALIVMTLISEFIKDPELDLIMTDFGYTDFGYPSYM